MKETIVTSKQAIAEAKSRHQEASADVKRIERDMSEFTNNKDSKLSELQKSLEKLKRDLSKNAASIKPLQQELREVKFDSEQCGGDLAAAQETLQENESTLKALREEVVDLMSQQGRTKVDHFPALIASGLKAHVIIRTNTTLLSLI